MKKYIPQFVYGSIDGLVTTFAIVSGVVGAALSSKVILILGIANLLADGFSMGVSSALSQKSENDLNLKSKRTAIGTGIATFSSFVILGSVPLIPFILNFIFGNEFIKNPIKDSFILTAIAFCIVGWLRGKVTNKSKIYTTFITLFVGALASAIAYFVGYYLQSII